MTAWILALPVLCQHHLPVPLDPELVSDFHTCQVRFQYHSDQNFRSKLSFSSDLRTIGQLVMYKFETLLRLESVFTSNALIQRETFLS